MRVHTIVWGIAAVGLLGALQAPASGEDRAAEVLASTRTAIGGKKLDGMKSFSVLAKVQRNLGNVQVTTDSEFLLEMPDRFVRSDVMAGGPIAVTSILGFNGDTSLARVNAPGVGGAMRAGAVVRMVGPGVPPTGSNEPPTPEQQAQMSAAAVRMARHDISRMMLGWFGMAHPTLGVEYRYAGEAESPDGRAHVIDVKNADGFSARLFIDHETSLPLMLTYTAPQMRIRTGEMRMGGPGSQAGQGGRGRAMTDEEREKLREEIERMHSQPPGMAEYTLFFADWREADGIRFPHTVQRATGGTTDEEWSFSRVKVNPKIDARRFQPQG